MRANPSSFAPDTCGTALAFTDEQCGAAPVEWLKATAHQQIVLPTQSSGTEETQ
jgi:hypothetical protein